MKTARHLLPAVMMLITISGCTLGPEQVAKKFLEAQENKDFKTIRTLSTPESGQMIDLMESFMAMDTSKRKSNIKITKCELSTDSSSAICSYCCDREGRDGTLHVRKTSDGWKVDLSLETLMGGKAAMDEKIRGKAALDSISTAPETVSPDTGVTVPAQ